MQLTAETRRLDRQGGRAQDVGQQAGAGAERGVVDHEGQRRVAPADGGDGRPGPGLRGDRRGAVEPGVRPRPREPDQHPQARVAERLAQDPLDALGCRGAVVDPVGEGLHPLDRAGPVAVEAAIHHPLQTATERVERERRGHRRHRRAGGGAAAERLRDEEREGDGPGREHHGERDPRDRPADDPVDVVQAVAQHRDHDRGGQGQVAAKNAMRCAGAGSS